MAIDTAEKRRSIGGILTGFPVGVTPNLSKDIQWRQEAGWGYPGITPSGGTPVSDGPLISPFHKKLGLGFQI